MLAFRFFIVFVCLGLMLSAQSRAENVRIAVAANFIKPAKALARKFEESTGDRVIMTFSSTGKLYAQILKGARYHMFLAADKERPRLLVDEGLASPAYLSTYAFGRLVMFVPNKRHLTLEASVLDENSAEGGKPLEDWFGRYTGRYIAIANPKLAPYGEAALTALESYVPDYEGRFQLVKGESIGQAFQMVYTGAAGAGLVSLSQVIDSDNKDWLLVPRESHSPIEQQMTLLNSAETNAAAQAFYHFVSSEEAKAIIRQYGYEI